ncbi:hypothetical protein DFQ30_001590, partial [Apophysomyces sp. BC1015]
ASMPSSSASRFATQMSRHISGLDAAIRVKSRNPPPANDSFSAASDARRIVSTSANDSTCGKWLTAANTASCWSAVISCSNAPLVCHIAPTRSTSARGFSASGHSTTLRPTYRSASAASTPLDSRPAIGCPGTNCAARAPNAARAAAMTSAFVLPASVTIV